MSWPAKSLGDLCQIELGGTPARAMASNWDINKQTENVWLSIADLPIGILPIVSDSSEYLSDEGAERVKIVTAGTLLVSFKLTLGRMAIAGRDLRTNEAIAAITIKPNVLLDQRYLYWFLTYFDWHKAAEGDEKIKGKTLNKEKLKALPVLLPPLDEQRRIVAILDEAFEAIATATANAEKARASAAELIGSYVRFGLDSVGKDWVQAPIAECFKVSSGDFLPAKSMQSNGEIPVYGGNGIAGQHDEANLSGTNILIGRVGAKCGNIHLVRKPIWLTDNALFISKYSCEFDLEFLAMLLRSLDLRQTANQSAQPVISYSTIKNVVLSFPRSTDAQKEIAGAMKQMGDRIELLDQTQGEKIGLLSELRQSVLSRAFSGALSLPSSNVLDAAAE